MNFSKYVVLISLLFWACSDDDMTIAEPSEITIEEQIQNIIDEKIGTDDDKLVGVSLSIRIDGVERWKLTGGISKKNVPVTNDMIFGIGSVTKTAVAATILKLEELHMLDLEDTVDDHLDLNNPNVDGSITIHQLLTHFTGVKGYFHHPDIWPRVENNLDQVITPLELSEYIGNPINIPGREHQYSNSNFLLLGMIIEAVTSKTVGEVMREYFWEPLNLQNIFFGSNEVVQGTMATPWRDTDGDEVLEDISADFREAYYSVFYCAAGIYATASDLSMWAHHLYQGDALAELSKDKMLQLYATYGDPIFKGYGLGVRQNVYGNRTMWGHTGGMRGYGAHMFHSPAGNVSIAVLNNQSRSVDGPLLRHELIDEVMEVVFSSL